MSIIKKVFKMEELDCANCASKMEALINKIDGVEKATVSFMTQKLTIEAEEEKFPQILIQAQKECNKIEPDTRIVF